MFMFFCRCKYRTHPTVRQWTTSPSLHEATFYTYFLKKELMINGNENVLKARLPARQGQQILAQGKRRRSVALGWRASKRIVRAITFIKRHFFSRTKKIVSCFPGNDALQVRPGEVFRINYHIHADGFRCAFITRDDVSDRSSLNSAVRLSSRRSPGYCYYALSGRGTNMVPGLCIKVGLKAGISQFLD